MLSISYLFEAVTRIYSPSAEVREQRQQKRASNLKFSMADKLAKLKLPEQPKEVVTLSRTLEKPKEVVIPKAPAKKDYSGIHQMFNRLSNYGYGHKYEMVKNTTNVPNGIDPYHALKIKK